MLHGASPRAFLPPGLSYLGGYYGEDGHAYANAAARYLPCREDPYGMRIADPRIQLTNWDTRPVSPIPLDLSLKAAASASTPDETGSRPIDERVAIGDDGIEVDEEEPRYPADSSEYSSLEAPVYRSYLEIAPKATSGPPSREDVRQTPKIQRYDPPGTTGETEDSRSYVLHRENSRSGHQEYPVRKAQSPLDSGNHQRLPTTPQHHLQSHHAPMTPPSTPSPPQCPRRRQREEPDVTPSSSANSRHQSSKAASESRAKKKHARRLKFDEDTSSPVSGTVILGPDEAVVTGDIDPAFNIVEVTEEARAELAKIENRLGPYQCKLCRQLHEDAFQLAQHRCSRIAHVEYRCPECDKRFSCPANLASHRRWHKPRVTNPDSHRSNQTTRETEISCNRCDVKFTRAAALRKHLASQHPETNNNVPMASRNGNDVSNFEDLNPTGIGKPVCGPLSINLSNVSIANETP